MQDIESATIKRITWRLIPFLCICYFISWLDRVNVGFAALAMNADLGFSPALFGLGAGIFFIGYVLCEPPSNLALRKFGARVWIARIMITWGIFSGAMAFIQGQWGFLSLRFLLGIAEAGFFPGIILYLTLWFPAKYRGRTFGLFILTTPLASVIGGPISGALFKMHGFLGLEGWRWMFLIEAIPAVILGVMCLYYLTDKPENAKWLTKEQRDWLTNTMRAEEAAQTHDHGTVHLMDALKSSRLWLLGLVYLGPVIGLYGLGFWMPQIVKGLVQSHGITDPFHIGLLTAIPSIGAAIGMVYWTRHSDRTGERIWHLVGPLMVGAIGMVMSAYMSSPVGGMIALSIALIGINVSLPVFWTLPTAFLTGAAAAVGIAIINCIGNLGGYFGPQLIGIVKQSTDSIQIALLSIAALMVLAGGVALYLGQVREQPMPKAAPAE
jgi:ACS family tartrate transporter-like MFS transporter